MKGKNLAKQPTPVLLNHNFMPMSRRYNTHSISTCIYDQTMMHVPTPCICTWFLVLLTWTDYASLPALTWSTDLCRLYIVSPGNQSGNSNIHAPGGQVSTLTFPSQSLHLQKNNTTKLKQPKLDSCSCQHTYCLTTSGSSSAKHLLTCQFETRS
jgi:hypothetical protein